MALLAAASLSALIFAAAAALSAFSLAAAAAAAFLAASKSLSTPEPPVKNLRAEGRLINF